MTVHKFCLAAGILVLGSVLGRSPIDPNGTVKEVTAGDYPEGAKALGEAVWNGDAATVTRLLAAGANPDFAASSAGGGFPPVVAASRFGCSNIVELLLNAHADPNLRDADGNIGKVPAVHLCAQSMPGFPNSISGALPDESSTGHTALIEAARWGFPTIVSKLISSHAALDATDTDGNTALISAARFGHKEAVKQLLAAGANVAIASTTSGGALEAAAFEGSPDIVAVLLAAGANPRRSFGAAHKNAIDIANAFGNKAAAQVMQTGHFKDRWHRDFTLLDLGETPRGLRQDLLQGLVFKNADLIDVPAVDGQTLGNAEVKVNALQDEVGALGALLVPLVAKRGSVIAENLGIKPREVRTTTFHVIDSTQAGAFSQLAPQPGGGMHPDITVTMKLIQANLQASINEGLPAIANWERTKQVAGLQEARRDLENLAFLNLVPVQSPRVGAANLSLENANALGTYTDLVDVSQQLKPVESRYYGALMFVIAHELGHIALGHLDTPVPCHKRELEADAFAANLLGTTLLVMSASPLPVAFGDPARPSGHATLVVIDDDAYRRYTGSAIFFTQAYELAHFPPSDASCTYPSAQEREDLTNAILLKVKGTESDQVTGKLEKLANLGPGLGLDVVTRLRQMGPN
jgi:ankyrin repeat protein